MLADARRLTLSPLLNSHQSIVISPILPRERHLTTEIPSCIILAARAVYPSRILSIGYPSATQRYVSVVTGFPWANRGDPWLPCKPDWLPTGYPWATHDQSPEIYGLPTGYPWDAHELPMGYPCIVYGLSMGYNQRPTGSPLATHGPHINLCQGTPMGDILATKGLPLDHHGQPTGYP